MPAVKSGPSPLASPRTPARTLAAADYGFDVFVPGTLTITPAPTTLVADTALVTLLPPWVRVGRVSATLTFSDPALPVVGQPVVFKAGDTALCTGVTDDGGRASCAVSLAGTLALVLNGGFQATFAGSQNFLPSTARAQLIG